MVRFFSIFGHSESFKIYETEGNNIVRAEVIGTDGAGHSALAAVLKDKGVDVLICGGMRQWCSHSTFRSWN